MRKDLELLQGSIDLHVHSGPDTYERLYDHFDIARNAREVGMRAVVVKSHNFGTAERMPLVRRYVTGVDIFGSLNLNHPVGGLNPVAVETSLKYGARKIFLPTADARYHTEVITGLVGQHGTGAMVRGGLSEYYTKLPRLGVTDPDGALRPEVKLIIDMVADARAILSCGHTSPDEMDAVLEYANSIGFRKVIMDHPFWAKIPFERQEKFARNGGFVSYTFMEVSPRWWSLSVADLAGAIRKMGPDQLILTSDAGQVHNPPPTEAFRLLIQLLLEEGIAESDIRVMVQRNPAALLYE